MLSKKTQYTVFLFYIILIIFEGIYYIWELKLVINLSFYIIVLVTNLIILMFGTKLKYGSYWLYTIKDFNKHDLYYMFIILLMITLTTYSLYIKLPLYSSLEHPIVFSYSIGCLLFIFNMNFFNINNKKDNYDITFLYSNIFVIVILSFIFNYDFIIYVIPYVIFISLPNNTKVNTDKTLNLTNIQSNGTQCIWIVIFLYFFMKAQVWFPDYFISIVTSNEVTNFLLQFINGW